MTATCPECHAEWPTFLVINIDANVCVTEDGEGWVNLYDETHLACTQCDWTGAVDGDDMPEEVTVWARVVLAGPIELRWGD